MPGGERDKEEGQTASTKATGGKKELNESSGVDMNSWPRLYIMAWTDT